MGLVGLVSFLSGIESRISGISGISLLFEREWFRDDASSFGLYSRGVRRVYVRTWERRRRRRSEYIYPWSCVVWAHISVARSYHSALLTMFKGTSTNVVPSVYVGLTLGIVLHGHTYLSRVHTTVQCMTMFKGTVDGKKFAKGIHALRHATIPVNNPLSPSHSMLAQYDGTEREGMRTA